MAKYLLLKHYRGAPASVNNVPMELSAAPGAGGEPIHEWLEVRPFLAEPPTVTQ
jgi:hypothetical protein